MEDRNTLASDCIVISCCCQCLILQIVVFILLKLPYKLVQKTKQYAKKKLGHRKREKTMIDDDRDDDRKGFGIDDECHGYECCMEEVEKVLEELSQKGEFAFGSFWGRDESGSLPRTSVVAKQDFNRHNVVQCHLIEMVN
ncbi:unnamed protein product [Camellia sinensis]|nr:uncharacterized protein LOC114261684 [Camellia sinensis]